MVSTVEMLRRQLGILKCVSQSGGSLLFRCLPLSSQGRSFSLPGHFPLALGRAVDRPAVIFVVR